MDVDHLVSNAGRILFYAVVAAGAGLWIYNRRQAALEHNRKVQADVAAAVAEEAKPHICEDLQPLAQKVQAAIKSCSYNDGKVTVTLTSYRREAFTEFLWELGTSGQGRVDTSDKTNYFRELRDASGRQMFEHTFPIYKK